MADVVDASTLFSFDKTQPSHEIKLSLLWERIALGTVLLLSIFMDFFLLGQNGYGNLYYAAGVKSMADSWHNFFFVSFDPGGFVTVDKPPLGFWLQTLSVKLFGFTPFSIFFPQALCGVLAVLLLYYLVRRHFGVVAGLLAALALAVSPISVVTNRNNTIDGTLALALLLAAWAVIHAAETGKLRWLLLSGVFVGLGFNIKMSEAYLVVPALGLTYLLCAPHKLWTRIWHLLLVLLVMLAISLSWAITVDLTPAAQRPYVGSTKDNSELSLAFGYNGLNRLHIGTTGRPGGTANTGLRNPAASGSTPNGTNYQQAAQFPNGGAFQTGQPGPFHLFSASLGGQIAWLLPFALLGILALAWQKRWRFQQDRQQMGLILWGFWLLTMAIFFTVNGSFHQYYLTELAPGLSAMVGIGLVVMWRDYRNLGWRGWLLPIALLLTAGTQIYLLASYPGWSQWLSPLIGIITAVVVIALLVFRLRPTLTGRGLATTLTGIALALGLFILLLAPGIWSGYSVLHNTESSAPTAGPNAQNDTGNFAFGGTVGMGTTGAGRTRGTRRAGQGNFANIARAFGGAESSQADQALISYLESHQGNTKFLVATPSSSAADPIILTTNKPVMALGGFGGSDPILTTSDLQTLIRNHTIRYFLINTPRLTPTAINELPKQFQDALAGRGGNAGGFGQQNLLTIWVGQHCNAVPTSAWQTTRTSSGAGSNRLYDCANPHP